MRRRVFASLGVGRGKALATRPSTPPAVVIGLDGPTGLQTARILSSRGIGVVGLVEDHGHPCARTRSCARVLESPLAGPELVQTLLTHVVDVFHGEAVLVPCNDLTVVTLARWRDVLHESGFRFMLPDVRTVETLLNKDSFARFAREHAFPTPETRVISDPADLPEIETLLPFPCILKPSVKTPEWERKAPGKAIRIQSVDELRRAYSALFRLVPSLVVQEWIHGSDEAHFSCNCYFDRDGRPRATLVTRKLRQWPPDVGQGCLSVECGNDTVRDLTVELFSRAGHRGLGYLEVKRDERTGRHVILEANVGRPTGRSATAEASGVELLLSYYRDALGRPLPTARSQEFRGVKWIHLRRDLQASFRLWRRGELGLRDWWRSLRGRKVHALFSWTDPLPFFADGVRAALKYFREGLGRGGGERSDAPADRVPIRHTNTPPDTDRTRSEVVDYDLHGALGIRLVDPSSADVRAAEAVLGRPGATLTREPDLVVRFTDDWSSEVPRHGEEPGSAGTPEPFLPLRDPARESTAWIRLEEGGCLREVLARRNGGGVPFLQELVDVTALAEGWAPLHASAWVHGGRGVLAVGLEKSGKTGALLAFVGRGASVVGDDRIFVCRDGARMTGVARPLRIKDWHMAQLPWISDRVGPGPRWMAGASRLLRGIEGRIRGDDGEGGTGQRLLWKALGRLRRSLAVDRYPDRLVGEARCPGAGSPDVILALVSDEGPDVRVETMEPDSLASRLAATVAIELLPLVRAHRTSRFARPSRRWTVLEDAEARAAQILEESLSDRPAVLIRHPYPCSLQELVERMKAVTSGAAGSTGAGGTAGAAETPSRTSPGPVPSECPAV